MQPIERRPYYEIDGEMEALYHRIMEEEANFGKFKIAKVQNVDRIKNTAWQIGEFAMNEFIPRSYSRFYGLSDHKIMYESIAAHTNLVRELTKYALKFTYGSNFGESNHTLTDDYYECSNVLEAAALHDLPENVIGDIPDNGGDSPEKSAKAIREKEYWQKFCDGFPDNSRKSALEITRLLSEMNERSSPTGRLLYAADKTAAIIVALTLDSIGHPPMMSYDDPNATMRDIAEMDLCDYRMSVNPPGTYFYYRGSEMWTIDSLHIRHILADNDESGFFTALVVMYTLMVNGKWYNWRERDYEAYHKEHGSDRDYSKFNPDAKFE